MNIFSRFPAIIVIYLYKCINPAHRQFTYRHTDWIKSKILIKIWSTAPETVSNVLILHKQTISEYRLRGLSFRVNGVKLKGKKFLFLKQCLEVTGWLLKKSCSVTYGIRIRRVFWGLKIISRVSSDMIIMFDTSELNDRDFIIRNVYKYCY